MHLDHPSDADVEIIAEDPDRATQAPSDVLRLAVAVVILVVVVVVEAFFGDAVTGFAADLLRGLDRLPSWAMTLVSITGQAVGAAVVVMAAVLAVRTRSARLLVAAAAAAVAGAGLAALLSSLVDAQAERVTELSPLFAADSAEALSAGGVAALTAVIASVAPWTGRRWRRIGWTGIVCMAVALFATTPIAFTTPLAVLSGWVAGTAAVVIAGSPSHRPSGASIAAGLASVGVPLARLEQVSLDARGSTPYFGETTDGRRLFVKALGADERSADLMFRAYRRLQPRDLGDEKAFSTLRRAVEHEALVALTTRELGVRTPRLVAFATAEPVGCVLAYEAIAGRSLDRIEAEEMTDAVLDGVWEQLAVLRAHRVAHRDLRLANVFIADDGELWIIDFGFSELAASDLLLATDLAEMIASSATTVGAPRAVAAAVRAIGPEATATALDRMHLARLSGASRTALKADRATFDALRAELGRLGPGSPTA